MLTKAMLVDMPEGDIFAAGVLYGLAARQAAYWAEDGDSVQFVAVRGHLADWAVYVSVMRRSDAVGVTVEDTASGGHKVSRQTAERLVDCDGESAARYRR